ncbi:MAG: signal peptidase I [Oscillospiraceae bacterium]
MAIRNTEQDAAPERSATGEVLENEAATPAEETAITAVNPASAEERAAAEAVTVAPEQEQREDQTNSTNDIDSASDTDSTVVKDGANDTDIAEVSVQEAEEAPSEASVEAEQAADATDATVTTSKQPIGERIPAAVKDTIFDVLDTCESVVIAMFTVLLIFTYLFSVAVVEGDSMLPTLHDADRLLLMNFADPEPGDIVVLNSEYAYTFDENGALQSGSGLGKRIVKRLIATENQTVDIDFAAGIVYVDGIPLSEPYTSTLTTRDEGAFTYPITVPAGYVFVLGDNRSISKDSRHPDVALIPEEDIVGKVWLRVYPFDDFMAVN